MKQAVFVLALVLAGLALSSAIADDKDRLPAVSLQLSNMNVLYIGVDNPVKVAIDGVAAEDIHASLTGGSMSGKDGNYIVHVTSAQLPATMIVHARVNGSTVPCDTFVFRVKTIPPPVAYLNDIRHEGVMLKENLQRLSGVFARMENFDFDCSFRISTFSMSVMEEGAWKEYTAEGPALTADMKEAMKKVNENDKILFHNIIAKGPDGTIRQLNTITITVK